MIDRKNIELIYESRKPIWSALSWIYIDGHLDDKDYTSIVKVLKESKLSLEDLRKIDLYEVFPSLYKNLISPAGEWKGFQETWLYEQCWINHQRRSKKGFRISASIKNTLWPWMRKEAWLEIERRFNTSTTL